MGCCSFKNQSNTIGVRIVCIIWWALFSLLSIIKPPLSQMSKRAFIIMIGGAKYKKNNTPIDDLSVSWFTRKGFLRTANIIYKWIGTIAFFTILIIVWFIFLILSENSLALFF